jgi:predicted nicotinamide N-methyase
VTLSPRDAERFILENTTLTAPPHVPEIVLHLADEAHDLWKRTEEELAGIGLPPPFWAFAWAGGQGLARYLLDHPEIVSWILLLARGSSPSPPRRRAPPTCWPPISIRSARRRSG